MQICLFVTKSRSVPARGAGRVGRGRRAGYRRLKAPGGDGNVFFFFKRPHLRHMGVLRAAAVT